LVVTAVEIVGAWDDERKFAVACANWQNFTSAKAMSDIEKFTCPGAVAPGGPFGNLWRRCKRGYKGARAVFWRRVGFAYVPQAAESLASDSLRIPRVSRAGGLLLSADGFAAQTK